jgi:hypothetical protein
MAIQHPGGTIVNATFTGAVKQDIVSNLQTQLTAAGWSVVSGGGTTDVLMQSASTPTAANFIRVRLRSTNLTNCCCLNMQDAVSLASLDYYLLPAGAKTFRVIANQYQFFVTGGLSARDFVCMGVPYTPTWLHGVITGAFGWIMGNSASDGDTTIRSSFQNGLHAATYGGMHTSQLCNGSLAQLDQYGGSGPDPGAIRLVFPLNGNVQSVTGYRWHDDTLHLSDPLIGWGLTGALDEAKVRGQLWGAMVVSDSFSAGTILSAVDGHDWYAITNSNVGATNSGRGTLFVAIT